MSERILFVYKAEYFPFNAQQKYLAMNITILEVEISEDWDN